MPDPAHYASWEHLEHTVYPHTVRFFISASSGEFQQEISPDLLGAGMNPRNDDFADVETARLAIQAAFSQINPDIVATVEVVYRDTMPSGV